MMSERRGRSARKAGTGMTQRETHYRTLHNPFQPQTVFSDDEIEHLHQTALRVLQELGVKVLLPEARALFRAAGAVVDEDTEMVRIGTDIVEAALKTAPGSFTLRGGTREVDVPVHATSLAFLAGGGCPNASDRERGRRPGSARDFEELTRIITSFDVMHMNTACVEPQDWAMPERHYRTARHQFLTSPKVPFCFSRGTAQVEDCFEMTRLFRGLSEAEFRADPWVMTIVNTNSPRQLDKPMAQGIIDHARWGQLCIITPFCLLGAMAPVTVAGALLLQHAENLMAITLHQLAGPGAPVMYGNFASNVDMKSGAPAFGTPEHMKATLGSGQLARRLGLPWRSAAGTASNAADSQGAAETAMSLWATVLAGANLVVHSAGWLEGGLTHSYEKLILDLEMVEVMAEMCAPITANDTDLAFDAIREVAPGGHFFAAAHTMERFSTAFWAPFVSDWSNFGKWAEEGGRHADERATDIWKERLAAHIDPPVAEDRLAALDSFIAKRMAEGGAPPSD